MMLESSFTTHFEDLSDEIIISILEYLTLEDFITIFGQLNTRLACIIFDHPWTQHQLNIQTMDDETVQKKIHFLDQMKLTSRISSIRIRPFSIYHSIERFNQGKALENFVNLKALCLNNITLEEAESIFTADNLSKVIHLTRLSLLFSYGIEQNDYSSRLEYLISQILLHPPLRHVTFHAARSLKFDQIQFSSPIEYLDIDCCSFQSLYTLFEFTPSLRHLTAKIAVHNQSKIHKVSVAPLLNSVKLIFSILAFDDLTLFFKRSPKLRKLTVITHSVIEPLSYTLTWFQLITECLPALIKFKRDSNVTLANVEEYLDAFRWPNGWQLQEKRTANGENYSRITLSNTRY